ncbi:MAG: thiamine pyrophosphate-dependent enzyme [Corynebacterium sp.]|nr:thiamine pyrophosphate-dependent enzyme [Corynebacterium sp.]
MTPRNVIRTLNRHLAPATPVATDVGQHQMWAAQNLVFRSPRRFITSGGLGTMGFGLGAAIGAAYGSGERSVLITGDGSFGMCLNELATATTYNVPVVILIMNNGVLGMVRQWQTLFFDGNYSHTKLREGGTFLPDFVQLSQALGCEAIRVTCEEEVAPAIERARAINDRPVVIDFIVGEDAQVWPMVGGGASNEEIQYVQGLRPLFAEESSKDLDATGKES